jgi:hypothetical protein
VRWRDGAACRLYMQPRLRFDIHDDDRVRGQHEYMCCLRSRLQLRWQWRPGGGVFVLSWVRVDCDDVQRLRVDVIHVPPNRLWRGQRVCGRLDTAGRVHVQRWLRVDIHDDDRVRGQHEYMCCLRSRLQLRWQWRPGSGVFMLSWVRIDLDDVKRVCWQHHHMLDGRL